VCFSLAFSTVFQAFLTTFLIDSGYKTPIQNMDELFASGIKLVCHPENYFIFEIFNETVASKVHRNLEMCPSDWDCLDWALYQKNVSILLPEVNAEFLYATGESSDENSKPLLCGLEDGVVFNSGLTMMMFHGDPLMRRVNEIIDRVVEAGLYNQWMSMKFTYHKLLSLKKANVHQLDGYYSFNFYHLQTAFYLILMGWCVSALCFMVEVLFKCLSSKKMRS